LSCPRDVVGYKCKLGNYYVIILLACNVTIHIWPYIKLFNYIILFNLNSTNSKENRMEHNVVGWGKLKCIYLPCNVEEFHVFAKELGKGTQQDPQVVFKNDLIIFQMSVSINAIISFCCASCWVLDDIMIISYCCF